MTTGGNEKAPPTVGAARGAGRLHSRTGKPSNRNTKQVNRKPRLTFGAADGIRITVTGRQAQTLALLIERGLRGFTSGEASPFGWARRTSHYISCLRKLGLQIETRWELAGEGVRVGRYVLACAPPIHGEGV